MRSELQGVCGPLGAGASMNSGVPSPQASGRKPIIKQVSANVRQRLNHYKKSTSNNSLTSSNFLPSCVLSAIFTEPVDG